jgi:hypothetical protein
VNAVAELTVSEKLLLAGHALEEAGQTPFSAEALVVQAWKDHPATFGLKHFADRYPDSNKVLASIMGERGLARRGWFVKVGEKRYAVSREGRKVVRRLLEPDEPAVPAEPLIPALTRDDERFLLALFGSTALEKYREGRKPELTFADACRFWGITENLHGDTLDARLDQFKARLADLDRVLSKGRCTLQGGRSASAEDVALLDELHAHLSQRFSRHLNLLRNRAAKG